MFGFNMGEFAGRKNIIELVFVMQESGVSYPENTFLGWGTLDSDVKGAAE